MTPSEKAAIDMVVAVRRPEGGVGGLLREKALGEVIEDGRRLLEALPRLAEEVA